MNAAIRTDVWPAELRVDPDASPEDTRHVYPVRVIVTLDEVLVFEDGRTPRLVFRDQLVEYSAPIHPIRATKEQRRQGLSSQHIVTTETGHVLVFVKASGCGCGSRLKLLSLRTLLDIANQQTGQTEQTQTTDSFAAIASSRDK